MTIWIDYETDIVIDLDYQKIINEMTAAVLESEGCPYHVEMNVVLTDNTEIQAINREFRGIDAATDVLSFPMAGYEQAADFSGLTEGDGEFFNLETGELLLGDMIISVEKVKSQALEYGHSRERELAFLVTHSVLHLLGYDHMEEQERMIMEKKQKQILDQKGYNR